MSSIIPFDADRVRRNTPPQINWRIDTLTECSVREHLAAGPDAIRQRLQSLDREWDIERVLQTLAPSLILKGIALSALRDRRWLLLPAAVAGFLLQHAVQGWCPPLPLLRRMGVRTRTEIDRERRQIADALRQVDAAARQPMPKQ